MRMKALKGLLKFVLDFFKAHRLTLQEPLVGLQDPEIGRLSIAFICVPDNKQTVHF